MTRSPNDLRKIIHIDMDAYYASIEQRDHPHLRNRPVIVGGDPISRGVVCTCSYEARKFGIHSGMATSQAFKRCHNAILIHPRIEYYSQISHVIRNIFLRVTPWVEPLSLDEAYLDVTVNHFNCPSASTLAKWIQQQIFKETQLTASAGVSYNKFLAKVASDLHKPRGLTIITPKQSDDFIKNLEVGKMYGIGKVTEKHLISCGIRTGNDLRNMSLEQQIKIFGCQAQYFHNLALGIDLRPVIPPGPPKSISREQTYPEDITSKKIIEQELYNLAHLVFKEIPDLPVLPNTITVKLKDNQFHIVTRQKKVGNFSNFETLWKHIPELLQKAYSNRPIRLIGLGLSIPAEYAKKMELQTNWIQPEFEFMDLEQW